MEYCRLVLSVWKQGGKGEKKKGERERGENLKPSQTNSVPNIHKAPHATVGRTSCLPQKKREILRRRKIRVFRNQNHPAAIQNLVILINLRRIQLFSMFALTFLSKYLTFHEN